MRKRQQSRLPSSAKSQRILRSERKQLPPIQIIAFSKSNSSQISKLKTSLENEGITYRESDHFQTIIRNNIDGRSKEQQKSIWMVIYDNSIDSFPFPQTYSNFKVYAYPKRQKSKIKCLTTPKEVIQEYYNLYNAAGMQKPSVKEDDNNKTNPIVPIVPVVPVTPNEDKFKSKSQQRINIRSVHKSPDLKFNKRFDRYFYNRSPRLKTSIKNQNYLQFINFLEQIPKINSYQDPRDVVKQVAKNKKSNFLVFTFNEALKNDFQTIGTLSNVYFAVFGANRSKYMMKQKVLIAADDFEQLIGYVKSIDNSNNILKAHKSLQKQLASRNSIKARQQIKRTEQVDFNKNSLISDYYPNVMSGGLVSFGAKQQKKVISESELLLQRSQLNKNQRVEYDKMKDEDTVQKIRLIINRVIPEHTMDKNTNQIPEREKNQLSEKEKRQQIVNKQQIIVNNQNSSKESKIFVEKARQVTQPNDQNPQAINRKGQTVKINNSQGKLISTTNLQNSKSNERLTQIEENLNTNKQIKEHSQQSRFRQQRQNQSKVNQGRDHIIYNLPSIRQERQSQQETANISSKYVNSDGFSAQQQLEDKNKQRSKNQPTKLSQGVVKYAQYPSNEYSIRRYLKTENQTQYRSQNRNPVKQQGKQILKSFSSINSPSRDLDNDPRYEKLGQNYYKFKYPIQNHKHQRNAISNQTKNYLYQQYQTGPSNIYNLSAKVNSNKSIQNYYKTGRPKKDEERSYKYHCLIRKNRDKRQNRQNQMIQDMIMNQMGGQFDLVQTYENGQELQSKIKNTPRDVWQTIIGLVFQNSRIFEALENSEILNNYFLIKVDSTQTRQLLLNSNTISIREVNIQTIKKVKEEIHNKLVQKEKMGKNQLQNSRSEQKIAYANMNDGNQSNRKKKAFKLIGTKSRLNSNGKSRTSEQNFQKQVSIQKRIDPYRFHITSSRQFYPNNQFQNRHNQQFQQVQSYYPPKNYAYNQKKVYSKPILYTPNVKGRHNYYSSKHNQQSQIYPQVTIFLYKQQNFYRKQIKRQFGDAVNIEVYSSLQQAKQKAQIDKRHKIILLEPQFSQCQSIMKLFDTVCMNGLYDAPAGVMKVNSYREIQPFIRSMAIRK